MAKRDLSDQACYEKARAKGEPTFTLRGQDFSAPLVICDWIRANIMSCPEDKLFEALNRAIQMRNTPYRKSAD